MAGDIVGRGAVASVATRARSGHTSVAGTRVSEIALYALKGAVIIAISDIAIGGSIPSSGEIQAQAHTSLARLP